jgi:hypothetical protein
MVPLAFVLAAAIEAAPVAPLEADGTGQGQAIDKALQSLEREGGSNRLLPTLRRLEERSQQAQWRNWLNCVSGNWRNC